MPAFTFEKISPPVRRGPLPPIAKKQRGVIVKILDRFVERARRRDSRKEQGRHRPQPKKPRRKKVPTTADSSEALRVP
jgi:hypothetical protein